MRKGVAFRQAHQIVAGLVRRAERAGKTLAQLPLSDLQEACGKIGRDVYGQLGAQNVVRRYATEGAGGPAQLRKQLAYWTKRLKQESLQKRA